MPVLFINASELHEWMQSDKSLQLIDVREKFEFELDNIGGINVPMCEVSEKRSSAISGGKKVIVCRSGKRAEAVANMLEKEFNVEEMYVLKGGLLSWREEIDKQLDLD